MKEDVHHDRPTFRHSSHRIGCLPLGSGLGAIYRSKLLLQAEYPISWQWNETRCVQRRAEEQTNAIGIRSSCLGSVLEIRGERPREVSLVYAFPPPHHVAGHFQRWR